MAWRLRAQWAVALGTLDVVVLLMAARFVEPVFFALTVLPSATLFLWFVSIVAAFVGLKGLNPLQMQRGDDQRMVARASGLGSVVAILFVIAFMLSIRENGGLGMWFVLGAAVGGLLAGALIGAANVALLHVVRAVRFGRTRP